MMRDTKLEGIGSISGGEYNKVSIEGIGKVKGNIICQELTVQGIYKGNGSVQTEKFSCEGMARIFKNVKAQEIRIEGMLKVRGAKLEASKISCEGILTSTGEISADEIGVEGICSVAKMYGEFIKVHTINMNHKIQISKGVRALIAPYIGRTLSQERCIIDVIECTHLEADYLEAKVIKAHTIKLGAGCKVDRIECDGLLEYDESCEIRKIVAEEVKKENDNNNKNKGEIEMADMKLTKILDLYKESKINADEAEKMLKSLGSLGSTIVQQESPRFADDKLRVVVMKGNKLISEKEYAKGMTINVVYDGEVGNVECWGNLSCAGVRGNASADGNMKAENVGGNVKADGNVTCGEVSGNVKADGNVECGNVGGNITVDGSVTCGDVAGKITADGGVSIRR